MVEAESSAVPPGRASVASPAQPTEQNSADLELNAINQVVTALNPLSPEQRNRALEYVLRRFSFAPQETAVTTVSGPTGATSHPAPQQQAHDFTAHGNAIQDIRTLKETKLPKSANEMAALVAYYVSELAPVGERKKEIGKPDIERHFKAAGFRLPADAGFTLVNAKNAGYLDSAGSGLYTLNPVGYNLVVHRMGSRDEGTKQSNGKRRGNTNRRPQGKKQPRAKK
jgi:hypothetical protein